MSKAQIYEYSIIPFGVLLLLSHFSRTGVFGFLQHNRFLMKHHSLLGITVLAFPKKICAIVSDLTNKTMHDFFLQMN